MANRCGMTEALQHDSLTETLKLSANTNPKPTYLLTLKVKPGPNPSPTSKSNPNPNPAMSGSYSLSRVYIIDAQRFWGGKYRHNIIENDYCRGKPGLSQLLLILTLTVTLNPNSKDY